MSPILRPITGTWTLPNGGNPGRSVLTLTLTSPDYVTATVFVPDVVRVTVDEDGDVVPVAGYQGLTVEVDGKDRAVIWASEEGSVQATYRAALEGAQARDDLGEYLIPDLDEPITLQEILELGVPSSSPQYLTIQTYISEIFKGPWDENTVYQSGDQVRRGEAIYVARGEIAAGVDPVEGLPWELFFSPSALPAGGSTGAVLAKLSDVAGDADWTLEPSLKKIRLSTTAPGTLDQAGDLAWDDLDQALSYRTNGITVDIAQENLVYVRNPAGGSTIPKGAAVAVDGASSNRLRVKLCNSTEGGDGCRTLGVAITAIPSPGFGFVSTFGLLRGFDTGAIVGGGVAPGSELFISSTPGVLSTQPQASPGRRVTVGYVVTTGAQGSIFVTVRRGLTVNELDDVLAANPTDGQTLRYSTANGRYNLATLGASDVGAYPDTNPSGFVDATGAANAAPVQSVAGKTGAVTLAKADVGLGNVDNTSDLNKPISTATQTALDAKVSSDPTGITGADQITNMVSLTQAEYDAIGTKSATTFYVIAG